jgi:hypothetical protein
MSGKVLMAGALALLLAGCSPFPPPGRLVYGRCGMDAHTEAYPNAASDRRAYACKRDQDGFLESRAQGDARGN